MTTRNETQPRNIKQAHCQSCGSTDPRNIFETEARDGYTNCCNERVIDAGNGTTGRGAFGWAETIPTCAESGDCYHE